MTTILDHVTSLNLQISMVCCLNERGTIKDTADAVEETAIATQDAIHTLKVATREVAETAPTTLKTLKEVSNKVRSKITKKSLH